MDRFSAYLLVRRHLKRRSSRNQALAVEAVMEALAVHAEQPQTEWGVLGLLSQLDLEYAEQNPAARGRAASQQARLEGAPEAHARHLERWCRDAVLAADPGQPEDPPLQTTRQADDGDEEQGDEELHQVEQALLLATTLAEKMLGTGARTGPGAGAHDEAEARAPGRVFKADALAGDLDLRRQQGDPVGDAIDAALTSLDLTASSAANLTLAAFARITQDLR